MEAVKTEFDGLMAPGTLAEVTEIPAGCNIIGAKWLWYCKSHGMVDRENPRMIAMTYSHAEGVDHFETFAPTPSTTSKRLVVIRACKLDWDLRHLGVGQTFMPSESGADLYLHLRLGCG
ncbi:unnamed protein product [Sphacelaria rigidula]